jgi:hypothetical protein
LKTDANKKAEEVKQSTNQSLGEAADKAKDLSNEANKKVQQQ